MARHLQNYRGERRTRSIGIKLTPTERQELEAAAAARGARLSEFARERCLRRTDTAAVVGGAKRYPDARKLMRELIAIGNNLNQLARIANSYRTTPHLDVLRQTTEKLKAALDRVLALCSRTAKPGGA
jgi:hypothetical protein